MACFVLNSTSNDSVFTASRPAEIQAVETIEVVLNTFYILTNILIIVAVVRNRCLHTVANMFISSLAVSNLLLAVVIDVNMMLVISSIYEQVLNHFTECIYLYCFGFSMTCSLYNHFMIACERWLYIARPFLHPRVITYRSTICGVILSWILALLAGVNLVSGTCTIQFLTHNVEVFYGVVISALHFILSASMFIIYGHIAVIAKNQTSAIQKTSGNSRSEPDQILSRVRSTWRQVRMLVVVFGVYFLLTTPNVAMNLIVYIHDIDISYYETFWGKVIAIISHVQCGANFFTYCLQDRDFRTVLKKWILKIRVTNNCGRVRPLVIAS